MMEGVWMKDLNTCEQMMNRSRRDSVCINCFSRDRRSNCVWTSERAAVGGVVEQLAVVHLEDGRVVSVYGGDVESDGEEGADLRVRGTDKEDFGDDQLDAEHDGGGGLAAPELVGEVDEEEEEEE